MSLSHRLRRHAESIWRDVESQYVPYRDQSTYPIWWSGERLFRSLRAIPDSTIWNCFICVIALVALVWAFAGYIGNHFCDIVYNFVYFINLLAVIYTYVFLGEKIDKKCIFVTRCVIDLITYLHYLDPIALKRILYYVRLHRPLTYIWRLQTRQMHGGVFGSALKYYYLFILIRIAWATIWLEIKMKTGALMATKWNIIQRTNLSAFDDRPGVKFLFAVYFVNKMFVPIGPSELPANDLERVVMLLVMISGSLLMAGAAVASLSLAMCLYLTPEETFRSRYQLILKEMVISNIPEKLHDKVETFYKMYWHKQRAVSATQLLPTYPPTLPTMIFTDIYFEATQKSRILCNLTYEFLAEVSKMMNTIHYIPGDPIIKRMTKKSSIIYITYGDVEMVTAEDDSTPILRMARGTVLTPCAACPAVGCGNAHVQIRAATFCTAHVLDAGDLWRVALRYGRITNQTAILLDEFYEHLENVKSHYMLKFPDEARYKSSILNFKRNLIALSTAKDAEGTLLLKDPEVFLEIAGCYIMRNRSDTSATDEADAICLRSTFPCILQPDSSLKFAWNIFMSTVILTVCIVYPYYIVYKNIISIEFIFFDHVITVIYILDLIVHLSTGSNVEEGVAINFLQTSSQQIRSYWFALDVVATLPILQFIDDGHFAGLNKILSLHKVFRLLKTIEEMLPGRTTNVLRFMCYTLLLILPCYFIAALQQAFICFKFNYCLVTNFTHSPYWAKMPLDEETVMDRVYFGLYWAISMITFTTHKDVIDLDDWDAMVYTMSVLEISLILHIAIEVVYSATIMVTTALREDYNSYITSVKNFLIKNEVEPELRQRFITYLELCWYTDKAFSMTSKKNSIFHDLPPHVNQDILARQRSKYLLNIPVMKLFHKEDLKHISSSARVFYSSPNEIILNTGDITNEMYVIKKGMCATFHPITQEQVSILGVNNHFGVIECLLRLPSYYAVKALTHVQLLSISIKVLSQVPEVPQVAFVMKSCREQPEYPRLLYRHEAFLLYTPPESPLNTERFKLLKKYETDDEFLNPFRRLGYLSVLRYIFPRFTIRPDGPYLARYEWFRVTCAFLSMIVYPGYTYFEIQWPMIYGFTWLLDFSAYFDILQRMLIGYYNEKGILVYHPYSTATHYLKGTFITDLIACLPLEFLESTERETYDGYFKLTKTRQFLMMNRLIQLYRLPSAIYSLSAYIDRQDLIVIIRATPLYMALVNVLTSFIIFYSVTIYVWIDDNTQFRIEPFNDKGTSWIHLFRNVFRFNLTETPFNLHLAAYFWVVYETTTTGYNCFNPSNISMMQVLFVGMAMGAMMTTYFSVRIISMRANENKALAEYQEHIKDMMAFMKKEKLKKELRKQMLEYYEYNWDKMGGVDYTKMLKNIKQITLRTDAILQIYGPTFAKCPFLVNSDVSLLRLMGREIRSLYLLRDMTIVEEGDVIGHMYFVAFGNVSARMSVDDSSVSNTKLAKGSVFGNLEAAHTARIPMSFVATSRVHLLQIKSSTFHHILGDFPSVRRQMIRHRSKFMYHIAGTFVDKAFRDRRMSTPLLMMRSRQSFVKYLYFKDRLIQTFFAVISLLCVYGDIFNAGFQNNTPFTILFLYLLDIAFYFKMIIQFLTPYLVKTIPLKKVLIPLREEYFKTDFKYDISSCIPLEILCFAFDNNLMAFSCLRLNRFLRISEMWVLTILGYQRNPCNYVYVEFGDTFRLEFWKIISYWMPTTYKEKSNVNVSDLYDQQLLCSVTVYKYLKNTQERITINLTLLTLLSVLIWFTLFVHTATCIWYFIGSVEEKEVHGSSWIYADDGHSWCANQYLCSMYFVVTTFTQNGVGDVMPKNQTEVLFVCLLQILSTLLYMVYVGELSNLLQHHSFRSFSFYCKFLELQEFMKNNRVSRNLAKILNKYSLHLWRESRGMQVPHFLSSSPPCIKLNIMSAAYMSHLTTHKIFQDCEPEFLRQLVGHFQLYYYKKGMYVVKEQEITECMYFVHRGRVLETSTSSLSIERPIYRQETVFNAGQCFGTLEGLFPRLPFKHSYKVLVKTEILALHFHNWKYLLRHFPRSKTHIYTEAHFPPPPSPSTTDSSAPDSSTSSSSPKTSPQARLSSFRQSRHSSGLSPKPIHAPSNEKTTRVSMDPSISSASPSQMRQFYESIDSRLSGSPSLPRISDSGRQSASATSITALNPRRNTVVYTRKKLSRADISSMSLTSDILSTTNTPTGSATALNDNSKSLEESKVSGSIESFTTEYQGDRTKSVPGIRLEPLEGERDLYPLQDAPMQEKEAIKMEMLDEDKDDLTRTNASTMTSRLSRRYVRVRYEEKDSASTSASTQQKQPVDISEKELNLEDLESPLDSDEQLQSTSKKSNDSRVEKSDDKNKKSK